MGEVQPNVVWRCAKKAQGSKQLPVEWLLQYATVFTNDNDSRESVFQAQSPAKEISKFVSDGDVQRIVIAVPKSLW